jgi:hypothetical protein
VHQGRGRHLLPRGFWERVMTSPGAFWDDLNRDMADPEFAGQYAKASGEIAAADADRSGCPPEIRAAAHEAAAILLTDPLAATATPRDLIDMALDAAAPLIRELERQVIAAVIEGHRSHPDARECMLNLRCELAYSDDSLSPLIGAAVAASRAKLAASIRELWGVPAGSAIAAAIEKGQI